MKKLPNAPLQEVIFEAKWPLTLDQNTKQYSDPDFDFALGKFQSAIENEFPVTKSKIPKGFPDHFFNHQAMYQFWSGENKWPVIQMGPGILTVNETENNYLWEENYYPLLKKSLDRLIKAYRQELVLNEYSLKYIDAVRVADYHFSNWPQFIQDHLNFDFENKFDTRGKMKGFQFDQTFDLGPTGDLKIQFSSGQNNKKENVFIWQTTVQGNEEIHRDQLIHWLGNAHQCTSDLFKEICKEEFYGSFSK